jgi:hypothetical protein
MSMSNFAHSLTDESVPSSFPVLMRFADINSRVLPPKFRDLDIAEVLYKKARCMYPRNSAVHYKLGQVYRDRAGKVSDINEEQANAVRNHFLNKTSLYYHNYEQANTRKNVLF